MIPTNSSKSTIHANESISPSENNKGHRSVLIGIVVAIIVGIVVGGWLPNLAMKFTILGEIFLNSLMMIVVPLVVFSMIVGITGLGDIRNLGSIGYRTVLYYMATTGISVLIGIILVNIIQPGRGISHGEEHTDFSYTVSDENNRTITIINGKWDKTRYNEKYILILLDQNVHGVIDFITENSAKVKLWEQRQAEDVIYITSEDGTRLPFRRVNGRMVSAEPVLASSGLDPQGMKDIRQLITQLAEQGLTIFLSSHLLHEVEQICTKMAIINKGKLVIQGIVDEFLNSGNDNVTLRVDRMQEAAELLKKQVWTKSVELSLRDLNVSMDTNRIPEMNSLLVQSGFRVHAIQPRRSLEDYFLSIVEAEHA